jgi:hypothetical protein
VFDLMPIGVAVVFRGDGRLGVLRVLGIGTCIPSSDMASFSVVLSGAYTVFPSLTCCALPCF